MAKDRTGSPLTETTVSSPNVRHLIDHRELLATAKSIVIALRNCSEAQAFDELLDVAQRNHVTILGAARNLVDLATGTSRDLPSRPPTGFDHWEQLLTRFSRVAM